MPVMKSRSMVGNLYLRTRKREIETIKVVCPEIINVYVYM